MKITDTARGRFLEFTPSERNDLAAAGAMLGLALDLIIKEYGVEDDSVRLPDDIDIGNVQHGLEALYDLCGGDFQRSSTARGWVKLPPKPYTTITGEIVK